MALKIQLKPFVVTQLVDMKIFECDSKEKSCDKNIMVRNLFMIYVYTVQLPKTDNAWDKPIWLILRGVGFRKF